MQEYMQWLHTVTVLGYDEGIKIPADMEEKVKKMYEDGMTPKEAVEEIKKMING
jgi:uncharacterized protein YutE (UPF0331/DUF86 family)